MIFEQAEVLGVKVKATEKRYLECHQTIPLLSKRKLKV